MLLSACTLRVPPPATSSTAPSPLKMRPALQLPGPATRRVCPPRSVTSPLMVRLPVGAVMVVPLPVSVPLDHVIALSTVSWPAPPRVPPEKLSAETSELCVVSVRSSSPPLRFTVCSESRLFTTSVPPACVTVNVFGVPRMQAFEAGPGTPFGFQFRPAPHASEPAPPSQTLVQPAARDWTRSETLEALYWSW